MSNRAVSSVYRQIIDSTVQASQADFEEMGIESAVLAELQRSWEAKLAASRVADFTTDTRLNALSQNLPPLPDKENENNNTETNNGNTENNNNNENNEKNAENNTDKEKENNKDKENDNDNNNGQEKKIKEEEKKSLSPDSREDQPRKAIKRSEDDTPTNRNDDDDINSDLDDSDDLEGEEGDDADLVIALYDKVQRVKNKWKIHLKDGIVSVNGKDYLFNRCQGEFEW